MSEPEERWDNFTPAKAAALRGVVIELRDGFRRSCQRLDLFLETTQVALDEAVESSRQILEKFEPIKRIATGSQRRAADGPSSKSNARVTTEPSRGDAQSSTSIEIEMAPGSLEQLVDILADRHAQTLGLSPLAQEMAMIYVVAVFEGFVGDVYLEVIRAKAGILNNEQSITQQVALKFDTRAGLVDHLARKATRDFLDGGYRKQFAEWKRRMQVDVSSRSHVTADALTDIARRRNLFVHNNGLVTPDFAAVTPDAPPIGSRLVVTQDDYRKSRNALAAVVDAIAQGIIEDVCGLTIKEPLDPDVALREERKWASIRQLGEALGEIAKGSNAESGSTPQKRKRQPQPRKVH